MLSISKKNDDTGGRHLTNLVNVVSPFHKNSFFYYNFFFLKIRSSIFVDFCNSNMYY